MHLYFVAIMLPEELDNEIRSFQQEMASKYNASRQLKIPVHITLLPPFRYEREDEVVTAFKDASSLIKKPMEIELSGFGEFRNKVLFVNVIKTDVLNEMRAFLVSKISTSLELELPEHYQSFHPHVTIANRDLTRSAFLKAWPVFKNRKFKAHFNEIEIALLKHVDGRWKIMKGA
ncbi:MAG: 2'-5' RNA ligase family protein [Crocinitomicaceae bacterium]